MPDSDYMIPAYDPLVDRYARERATTTPPDLTFPALHQVAHHINSNDLERDLPWTKQLRSVDKGYCQQTFFAAFCYHYARRDVTLRVMRALQQKEITNE